MVMMNTVALDLAASVCGWKADPAAGGWQETLRGVG